MARLVIAIWVMVAAWVTPVAAQEVVWVQIEAHPSLSVAQQRAQVYGGTLPDVNGFSLGGSWYGIALGPYTLPDAQRVLQVYKAERRIPQDSYIQYTRRLGQQFWPPGQDILNTGAVASAPAEPVDSQTVETSPIQTAPLSGGDTGQELTAEVAPPEPQPADETPNEARRSESLLTAEERRDLQTALQAAGFYNAAIDGAFGRGTRSSMADWQAANGYEVTGILTTLQRQALMDDYNAPLISVGMQLHTDSRAGIQMQMPMGEIEFARYESPFAHYDPSGELGARVLLISQPGNQATLFGLYDIMQTLELVPLDGPRERGPSRFSIEGRGHGIVSHTEASLADGAVKGFTLVWPEGDEARRARVLAEMQTSFTRLPEVLDPAAGADAPQNVDLVSGLEIRKPLHTRSGFFIDRKGTVVTTAEAVDGCTRITLGEDVSAEEVASDARLGVSVLRPTKPLAPRAVASLRDSAPRLRSDVAVAGFSFGGQLTGPSLTFGTLADVKGLSGERELTRLALNALPGDAGGPVIDTGGGVVGMLLGAPEGGRQLPEDVSLATQSQALSAFLVAEGLVPQPSAALGETAPARLPAAELSRLADGMTVLVSCWD